MVSILRWRRSGLLTGVNSQLYLLLHVLKEDPVIEGCARGGDFENVVAAQAVGCGNGLKHF
jgi:hypothetical protein